MRARLLWIFMLVLGMAQARVVTFTPESAAGMNGEFMIMLDDLVVMEVSNGSCSSDMLTLRNNGATLSFSLNDPTWSEIITNIHIIVVSGDPANRISGSGYVALGETGVWTGEAMNVTLTNNATDWVGISKIVVCTNGSEWGDNEDGPLGDEGTYVFDCYGTIDGTDSLVVDTQIATFIQHKGDGSDEPAYTIPWRVYADNTVTIRMKEDYVLRSVKIKLASGYGDPKLEYSEEATESYVDGYKTISDLPQNLKSFTMTNVGSQTRWQQIEIGYGKWNDDIVVKVPRWVDFGTFNTGNRNTRYIPVLAWKATTITGASISEPFSVIDFTAPVSLGENETYSLPLSVFSQTKGTFADTLRITFPDTVCKVAVKAEVVDGVFGASDGAFPESLGYLYDANDDGRMEYFRGVYPYVEQYSYDGSLLSSVYTGNYLFSLDDMDGDGKLEIVCSQSNDGDNPGSVSIHGLDGRVRTSFPVSLDGGTYTVMLDANSDGRPDFYFEDYDNDRHLIYYQQPDGSFVSKEIRILEDPSEIENAMFGQYGANATVTKPVNFSGVSLAKKPPLRQQKGSVAASEVIRKARSAELFYGNTSPTAVDVNLDGYPDLLNLNNGNALLSIGDGTYYYGSFEGQTTVKDLNGDGMPDFVLYDEDSRTVTLFLYEGNNSFKKQVLMQNFNITGIYTFDFDHDGDVDILLPFDYTDSSQYAYFVFFENQGNNEFKKRERSFDYGRALSFIGGGDVDNDGLFEVVAREEKNIFLVDCQKNFEIGAESGVIATVPDPKSYQYEGDYLFNFGDFDNDGRTEWWGGVNFETGWSLATPYSVRESGRFDADRLNTAPQKMTAPSYVYDAAIDMLRVEWAAGSDAENSACDLSYALRIGSEPGKGDVWYAYADAEGRRLRPGQGNAGYNTYALVSTAGWAKGTYYLAVQAVDANGLGGAWSDEVTFDYSGLSASFQASANQMYVTDTLTLFTVADYDVSRTYIWDLGDGGREVSREGNRWQVVYDQAGRKTVSLSVTDADGLMANSEEVSFEVYPLRWVADSISDPGDYWSYSTYSSAGRYFDIDMNGSLDVVGSAVINSEQSLTGVFSNEENNNRFKKVGRTYNSDLNPDLERIIPIDFNMDGIPDFMGNTNKGNLFINEGSFDFTYSTETYTVPPKQSTYDKEITEYDLHDIYSRFDFDNDGYLDVAYGGFHYLRIGINRGDNLSFDRQTLPDPDSDDNIIWSMGQWIDFNRDGYMDFWYREADDAQRVTWRFIVYLNNGDGTFERKQVYETPYWDSDFSPFFFDLNNDGWQDIIWSVMPDYDGGVLETGSTHIVLGDASMSYVGREEIVLDGYAFNGEFFCYGCGHESRRLYDVDNNGWLDLPVMVADGFRTSASGYVSLQTATGLLYLYPDWETVFEKGAESPVDEMPFADLNGDGLPDGNEMVMTTKHTNTAPEAPKNVRAVQTEEGVLLQWDDARDAETPAVHLRYNVSLKRKGATGANSYVISPMNGGSDLAAAIPGYRGYRTCNRMVVPTRRFEVGQEYELKVQTIDLWNAHSPFSETFTFRMESQVSIDAPAETCTERVVTVTYQGTESGTPQWSAGDGGELLEANGNSVDMVWSTSGVKTITVTVGGITSERSIKVNEVPDLSVDFPEAILIKATAHFNLPDLFGDPSKHTYLRASFYRGGQENLPTGSYTQDSDPIAYTEGTFALAQKSGSTEARLVLLEAGRYWMDVCYDDPVCGEMSERFWFDVVDVQPEIAIVGVDGGKNVVQWNVEAAQASGVDFETVRIYKETGSTNNFVLVGEAALTEGRYVDPTSDPMVRKSRYTIDMSTADGMTSGRSPVHGSVHIMLNQGITPNSVNIVWTAYEGGVVDQYTILRGSSPDALEVLTTASGYETSYTDQAKPDGEVYYALQYTNLYSDAWGQGAAGKNLRRATQEQPSFEGRSNVVNGNQSATISMAESLHVMVLEPNGTLTPEQTTLHLYAEVLPATATYKRVNWQVLSGSDLAELDESGVLTYTGNGANGTVRVQASTIDGSNLQVVKDIPVSDFGQGGDNVPVSSIYISAPYTTLTPLKNSVQLSAEVYPTHATDQRIRWMAVGDSPVILVSNTGLAVAQGMNGVGTIRAVALDGSEAYGEITLTASGFESGIDDATTGIRVYSYNRTLFVENVEGRSLDLFDLTGRHVNHVEKAEAQETISSLDAGIYLLYIEGDGCRRVMIR